MALHIQLLAFLAVVLTIIEGGSAASTPSLQCVCNTQHCKDQKKTTCDKAVMCYTQYLKHRDGSDPITRGCIVTRTSLLCENRKPAVANWPLLACCKNQMCNEQLPSHFAALVGNATVAPPVSVTTMATTTERSPTEADEASDDYENEEEEDAREEPTEVQYPSRQKQTPSSGGNKIYNNPRFLETIRRPELKIVQQPTDHGLTSFHAAVLITALAAVLLIFLLGFIIVRRQARIFNTSCMRSNAYTKGTNLAHHEHHRTPTRMPLSRGIPRHLRCTAYDNQILQQQPPV